MGTDLYRGGLGGKPAPPRMSSTWSPHGIHVDMNLVENRLVHRLDHEVCLLVSDQGSAGFPHRRVYSASASNRDNSIRPIFFDGLPLSLTLNAPTTIRT